MRRIFWFTLTAWLLGLILAASLAHAQPVVEAKESDIDAGTKGVPYVVTPRRLAYAISSATAVPIVWRGAFNAGTDYAAGDGVSYSGSSYYASGNPTTGDVPGVDADWSLLASAGATGATGATGAAGAQGPTGNDGVQTVSAIGNAGTTETISWTDYDTYTLTLDQSSLEITLNEAPTSGQDRTIKLVITQDATGGRAVTWASGPTLSATPYINPRANAVTEIYLTTLNAGSNVVVSYAPPKTISFNIVAPNDLNDSLRDGFRIWQNRTGQTWNVVAWYCESYTDNTEAQFEKSDADGANNAAVDAVNITTDGTGIYYASDTTITSGAIANGQRLLIDHDDTDTPINFAGTLVLVP